MIKNNYLTKLIIVSSLAFPLLSYSANWTRMDLAGTAAHDKLNGPTINGTLHDQPFECTRVGSTTVSTCQWFIVYNTAQNITWSDWLDIQGIRAFPIEGVGWTINGVSNSPVPAEANNRAVFTGYQPNYGYLINNPSTACTIASQTCSIPVSFSEPQYILISSTASGNYREGKNTSSGSVFPSVKEGSKIYSRWSLYYKNGIGKERWFQGSALALDGGEIDVPIINPPSVVCNFSVSEDLDLGSFNSTSDLGTRGLTHLTTECTGPATITATMKKTGGNDNTLNLGGINIQVVFSNDTNVVTYSGDKGEINQDITAKVDSMDATLTPGEHMESMIITLDYK